ncbi:hypothetical protein SUBVAR_07323 [Subdoligranulum variabile DSM 15176]|uniref:Uncharacterized protein n=1 Tax=Subdoligranulum variabile DSM 15176 TaxID=411471 RepID=D1PSE1_9FIRM|nr:hypothetical protein SUBVAR_07323 [Subdoligranulum variabile DSM 15176]
MSRQTSFLGPGRALFCESFTYFTISLHLDCALCAFFTPIVRHYGRFKKCFAVQ